MGELSRRRKEAKGELAFARPLHDWFQSALPRNRIELIEISPEIAIDATRLPEWEHKDLADRLIVATARVLRMTVVTSDRKILAYPHVATIALAEVSRRAWVLGRGAVPQGFEVRNVIPEELVGGDRRKAPASVRHHSPTAFRIITKWRSRSSSSRP